MSEIAEEKGIYLGFWTSVLLKGALSIAEIVSGLIVLLIPTAVLLGGAQAIMHSGLLGGADSFLSTHLLKAVDDFTRGTQTFVALYLLIRGVLKLAFIIALLKNKLWAYPGTLAVLGALVIFQLYQILTTHSLVVTGITIFDLIVMYFIWSEYKVVKMHHGQRKEFFDPATSIEATTGTE